MDRRQQKTRQAIFAAFERLLAQENYEKITVQEIIDAANVGRSTFYAHFETKDSLLEALCTDLFDHVFSDHPDAESTHDFSLAEGDASTVLTHILYHLQDNGKKIARLLTGESGEVFQRYFKQYLNALVTDYLLAGFPHRRNPDVPEGFLRSHIAGSFVNMVQWWVRGGMRESPEELAGYYLAVIEPIL